MRFDLSGKNIDQKFIVLDLKIQDGWVKRGGNSTANLDLEVVW